MIEPASRDAVERWIDEHAVDAFADVREASVAHRLEHGRGCTVYPTSAGPLLGVLAAVARAERVLEVGSGLGYSALSLASGLRQDGVVETIERDPGHARLARLNVSERGFGDRVRILEGSALELLPSLDRLCDLVFCDADPRGYERLLDEFLRLLRPGGLLVSANLFLAQFDSAILGLEEIAGYRARLVADDRLQTAFLPDGMALSVRR